MLRDWITCPNCKTSELDVLIETRLTKSGGVACEMVLSCAGCDVREHGTFGLEASGVNGNGRMAPPRLKPPVVVRNAPAAQVATDFVRAVREGIASRDLHVLTPQGTIPEDFARWGHAVVAKGDTVGFERRGACVGYVRDDTLYLITTKEAETSALGMTNVYLRRYNRAPLPYGPHRIISALVEEGLRPSRKVTVLAVSEPGSSKTRQVATWPIKVDDFFAYAKERTPEQAERFARSTEAVGAFFARKKG